MEKKLKILIGATLLSSGLFSQEANKSNAIISAVYTRISSSMNIFGNLYSSTKPLQYNSNVNTVTFVQRKSPTYTPSSNGNSGSVVVYLNKDLLNVWDSSCVWTNSTNAARAPQGGLYNPPSNTNLQNTYLISMGSTLSGSNTSGDFYASKLTGASGNNTPGADMQFFSNTTPFNSATSPLMKKHDYSRNSFSSSNDGVVRSIGGLFNNVNGTTEVAKGYRGAAIVKGNFVSGAMVWTMDSLIPPVVLKTNGAKQMLNEAYMAWNDAGTVGYVVFIGSRAGAAGSNIGWQPIVYKTTNSGSSWTMLGEINFNDLVGCAPVLNSLDTVTGSLTLKIPYINPDEGIDLVVDKCDYLHIVSTVKSTKHQQNDSLHLTHSFSKGGESYPWKFGYGSFPTIFDFRCDNTASWSVKKIDSCGSTVPGSTPSSPGFASNPWSNNSEPFPVSSGMRVQTSLSVGGDYILYSWAESDTTITTGAVQWNEFPNLHARAMRICDGAISTDEYLISSPSVGFNPRVRDKSYFHHISPSCKVGSAGPSSATFTLPVTVSNNLLTDGSIAVDHFYSNVIVAFTFSSNGCSSGCYSTAAINPTVTFNAIQNNEKLVEGINSYPNPFNSKLTLSFEINHPMNVAVEVYNYIGQRVLEEKLTARSGKNNYELKGTEQLKPGVYLIKLKLPQGDAVVKVVKE